MYLYAMDAVFNIKAEEFDETLFKKIKALLRKGNKASVLIHISDEQDVYQRTLTKSIQELNQPENLLSFTMESLEAYNPSGMTSLKEHDPTAISTMQSSEMTS
jgi:hypothetical protein